MATTKFQMPSEEQIWAEVDEQLARVPDAFKLINRVPNRQDLFDKKKAWYQDTPRRMKAQAEAIKAAAKAAAAEQKRLADADSAYLALRAAQGKPIITVKQFKIDYPKVNEQVLAGYSQQKLHETYEWLGFILAAKEIQGKFARLQAASRALTYKYLAQTYGLYRRIVQSDAADAAFEEIKEMLWNEYKVRTHSDLPRPSLLLKLVFEGALGKTINLYTRCIQLAHGYDIEEAEFVDFIKQLGGMEKIRKAYATVIAADDGKWMPAYEQDAEYSASLNTLHSQKPIRVVQLVGKEGNAFNNDLFGYYCLVVAHIDPLNQLELYGQWPASKELANEIIKKISIAEKKAGSKDWLIHKAKASALSAERLREKLKAKADKQHAKEKKAAAASKRQEAAEKRFAKQRAVKAV